MAIEIERKFLVVGDGWRDQVEDEIRLVQGYLTEDARTTVRVRIRGETAYLTIKGATQGISRLEFEYPIPVADAETLLHELAVSPLIEKIRYRVRHGGHLWELDVFAGANAGLVLAELELETVDEVFARPDWLGSEVSDDPRYFNVNLAQWPYGNWS
ncbi:CYTH domain-containing protein [Allochromatium vinosum]|uniref:Adenylate cyclase n=1 Tax=Allochromatium vinosum (strain ATCC 17899 / DSM 180 / NBRC 103801 / NCIMB 10441 / D) TaxID=572477 RepID=D3RSM1_ALLVD|nr:CYTH domain-containing protein [Allochromatium vinosum]ADC62180.1 adenylate cyclase [Allochromatium vinosum DSM 180]